MRKISLAIVLTLVFLGCKEEASIMKPEAPSASAVKGQSDIKVENGRLSFTDTKTYFETLTALDNMSEAELNNWETQHNINSLKDYFDANQSLDAPLNNEEFLNFPNSYKVVLSKNAEVKIGDEIVWYNNGTKHFISGANETRLLAIKADPSISETKGTYSITLLNNDKAMKVTGKETPDQRIYPSTQANVVANGYQYQFAYCLNGTSRKYVSELYSIMDQVYGCCNGYGDTFHAVLTLRIKLEWMSSKGWRVAGEYRWINYNVTCSLKLYGSAPYIVWPPSGYDVHSYSGNAERNSDLIITLFNGGDTHYYGDPSPYYDVELTGYIEQSITNAYPVVPGGALCNTYRAPYAGANTSSLLW